MNNTNILIVDDDCNVSYTCSELINMFFSNVNTITANSVMSALRIIKRMDINLIITDLNLKEYSSKMIIDYINKISNRPYVILMSGDDSDIPKDVDYFLLKPFKPLLLKESIKKLIGTKLLEN